MVSDILTGSHCNAACEMSYDVISWRHPGNVCEIGTGTSKRADGTDGASTLGVGDLQRKHEA